MSVSSKKPIMGSMPVHSILKGSASILARSNETVLLHRIFEKVVTDLSDLNKSGISQARETLHGIKLTSDLLENPALIYQGRRVSYTELNESANRLARAMAAAMSCGGDRKNGDGDLIVAVCLPPSDTLILTLLACWKLGAAYLPIDPTFPSSRIEHILGESEPGLVIVHQKDRHIFSHKYVRDIESLQEMASGLVGDNLWESETMAPKVADVDRTGIVLYTSGSTGVPKGVRLNHSAVLNRLKWQWDTFPYSPTENVGIFKTALTFVDSVSEIWGPLLNGRTVLVVPKEDSKDAERIMDILEQYKIERLVLVPTLLQSILLCVNLEKKKKGSEHQPLKNLRIWVCSGEALLPPLVQDFYAQFNPKEHKLCNFYGSTEVMGDVTFFVINDPSEVAAIGKVAIGKPTTNSVVYLLDDKLNPVNVGETGEIYVSGLNLAKGYVRNRDPDRFIDNNILVDSGHRKLYRTGDYGCIRKNILYYDGRRDSQIKVRGHRVDLSEVQAALKKIPMVEESVVLAYNPGQTDQAVLAFVIVDKPNSHQEVQSQMKNILPAYMVPDVVQVDAIPLLVNGKVDRQFLLQMYRNQMPALDGDGVMDFTGIAEEDMEKAKAVFETMVEVLGASLRGKITANSRFFALGGNSLNAVFFVTKLCDLGYAISIADFLKAPTLADVIEKVSRDAEVELLDDETTKELHNKYRMEMLSDSTRKEFTEILSTSFYEKADLERYMTPQVPYSDYSDTIDAFWKYLMADGLSFVVRNANDRIIGATMNHDAYKEIDPSDMPVNRLSVVLDFLDSLEQQVLKEKLPKGEGKVFHNFMMGSRNDLTVQETIELFIYMEEQNMELAKSLNYEGVFTSNTSPLTQQLGKNVNNYETMMEYKANEYVAQDGTKPFGRGPDSLTVVVSWKPL